MKVISSGSIEQYRNVVKAVKLNAEFVFKDEKGEAVYDESLPKPTIKFIGTVKLHGTQGCVNFNPKEGYWCQSRENIITPTKDNSGFAFFATNRPCFEEFFKKLFADNNLDNTHTTSIFGEFVGKGVQKSVAISEIEKAFFVFGAKVSKESDPEFVNYWVDHTFIKSPEDRIYNISDYKKYEIEIDFNRPGDFSEQLEAIATSIGDECPVAKEFGIQGLGEGCVFLSEYEDNRYLFKVKDSRHSVVKTSTPTSIAPEVLESIEKFVDYAVTENRLNQALSVVCPKPEDIDVRKTGEVIKWMLQDIIKEEMDTLKASGLEPKQVNPSISNRVRKMFHERLDDF